MKVAEYHRQGLKHRVDTPPEGYIPLGTARDGGHRVSFYARVQKGHLAHVVHTGSKRCRKLLALADVAAARLQGQPYPGYTLKARELLDFFREERDKAKMTQRVHLVLRALGLAEDGA